MKKDIIKEALEDVKRIKVLAEENAKKTVKTIAQKQAEKIISETFDMESEYDEDELMSEEELDDVINELDMEDEDTQSTDEYVDTELGMEDDSEFGSLDEDELDDALADFSDESIDEEAAPDTNVAFQNKDIKIVEVGSDKYDIIKLSNNKKIGTYDIVKNRIIGIVITELNVNVALAVRAGIKAFAVSKGKDKNYIDKTIVDGGVKRNMGSDQYKNDEMTFDEYTKYERLMEEEDIDLDSALMEFEDTEDEMSEKAYCESDDLDSALMEFEDTEDELDEAMDSYDEDDLDKAIEETKSIGFASRSRQSQEGNGGIKGSDSYGTKDRGMNEAVVKKYKDALRGEISREKKLVEAIGIYKEQLEKLSVLNTNLAHVTTIFLENASTKDEKITIAKRFDKVSDVKQSKKLYEAISLELQGKKTPTKTAVDKKVRGMVIESKANINETKNEDPSFKLMRSMGMFD